MTYDQLSVSCFLRVFAPSRAIHPQRQRGAALVIVLAFVVLLTGLVMAFLANSLNNRKIVGSSVNQTKVELFAQGALDTVIGDLKQEIDDGSTSTNVTNGTVITTIYTPKKQTSSARSPVMPALVGSTGTNGLENLIKVSQNGSAFYDPALNANYAKSGPSRAALVSSTNVSQNGRSISPARWNKPLLIAPTSTSDLTPAPAAGFTPPDWILVARDGSNPTSWNANMKASSSNSTSVVGRYAYAIYDEGGLLDANVAGYPSAMGISMSAVKNALAFADLTQLTNATGSQLLTTSQIDTLVGWRNYASAQPTRDDSTGNYTFTPDAATNYYNAVNSNSTGFLTAGNKALNNGESDRMITSRQQLIQFFAQKLGGGTITSNLQNALQYFGTFSRSLNQPSFIPDLTRPRVAAPANNSTAVNNYRGGNDAWGVDDNVNPSFLTVRVSVPFTRNDGSLAVVGEALVKKRFDLRRLAWLTYRGPSAGLSGSDITQVLNSSAASGIDQIFLDQGTTAVSSRGGGVNATNNNIYNYFGLTFNSADGSWTYSHNPKNNHIINRLEDLTDREPDFFELLKAAINAGSIGKSGAGGSGANDAGAHQHALDFSSDYQILQIGANIIDQSDADGFPTWIQCDARDFFGTENLPMLNRTTFTWALQKKPTFATANATIPAGRWEANQTSTGNMTDPGAIALFLVPHVWNVHDQNDITVRGQNLALGTPRPLEFRMTATSNIRNSISSGLPDPALFSVGAQSIFYSTTANSSTLSSATCSPLNANLTFGDAQGSLFRESTMLWKKSYPAGSNLTGSTEIPSALDPVNQTFTGFWFGNSTAVTSAFSVSNGVYVNAVVDAAMTQVSGSASIGTAGSMTYFSEYQNPSGSWCPYDMKCWDYQVRSAAYGTPSTCSTDPSSMDPQKNGILIHGIELHGYLGINFPIPSSSSYSQYGYNAISMIADPRTARFGGGTSEGTPAVQDTIMDYSLVPNYNYSVIYRTRAGMNAMITTPGLYVRANESVHGSGPGTAVGNCSKIMFYEPVAWSNSPPAPLYWGMYSQNNPYATLDTLNAKEFYTDADGVTRRAMAAYVPVGATQAATQLVGLPMATATTYSTSNGTVVGTPISTQSQSRPIILNRPFKTVDELGYVFRGTPWKNLDFFTPESGDTALLDVFCVGENSNQAAIVAGKVNLNTRQKPVLMAVIAGGMYDELTTNSILSSSEVANAANALVARSSGTNVWQGPISNVGELVGRFVGNNTITGLTFPSSFATPPTGYYLCKQGVPGTLWSNLPTTLTYSGLSADLDSSIFTSHATTAPYIQRLRQSAIRPLVGCGQARVWNLFIDLVAQTGRYPHSVNGLDSFSVEGEKRYWLHLALDRLTGQVCVTTTKTDS